MNKIYTVLCFVLFSFSIKAQTYCDSLESAVSNIPAVGTVDIYSPDITSAFYNTFGLDTSLGYWFAQLTLCGGGCSQIVPVDSINHELVALGYDSVPSDTSHFYPLPVVESYLNYRFPNIQMDQPSWLAFLMCAAPADVNLSDTAMTHCDTALFLYYGVQANLPEGFLLPYWAYDYVLGMSGYPDTTIDMLNNDLKACSLPTVTYLAGPLFSTCDSFRSLYYVYQKVLAKEGAVVDTNSLDNVYSALFNGQSLPYATIMSAVNNCNPNDTAILTTIVYTAKNLNYSDSAGQYFIDFDVFASDTPVNLLFAQSNIFIQYDSTIFGTNLVSSGKIRASKGMAVDSPYYHMALTDSTSTMLKIAITHTPSPASLANLDSVNQQLCHLRVNVTGFNLTSVGAYFDTLAMAGHSAYQQTPSGLEFPYDKVLVSGLVGGLRSDYDAITFGIEHPVIDPSLKYLDFDIMGFTAYIDAAMADYRIIISCDQYAFDSAGVSNTLGPGDDGNDTTGDGLGCCGGSEIYSLVYSFTPGQLTIEFMSDSNFNNTNLYQIGDYIFDSTYVAHVRLRIADCGDIPHVRLDISNCYADWADTTLLTNNTTAYYPVLEGNSFNNNNNTVCVPTPKITWVSPYCTNAGSFEVVTINGRHFGTDTGTVYFTNANTGSGFISTLKQDIIHWDSIQIQLLIPSDPTGVGIAGSGNFYIKTPTGHDNSADSVKISIGYANYNVRNWSASIASGNNGKATFVYLRDSTFVFQLDSALFNNADAKTEINNVMSDMSGRTGITFTLDLSAPSTATGPDPYDHINLISLQSHNNLTLFPNPGILGFTDLSNLSTICFNDSDQYNDWGYTLNGTDITIIDTPYHGVWMYDQTQNAMGSQYDFYTEIQHELGHAALLCHTLGDYGDNVMYPIINKAENVRTYVDDPDDVLGIQHMISVGSILGAASGCPALVPYGISAYTPTPACVERIGGINSIAEVAGSSSGFSASLYPNPYQDNTIIHIDVSEYGDFSISMYDMVGHMVSHQNISGATSFDVSLSDFTYSAGIYLIEVSDIHSRVVLKMVKL
jgi:hypothetical protein